MKIKLAVIFGGKSVEHEISVISALQACEYINREKYDLIPLYMTKAGEFYVGEQIGNIERYKDIPQLIKFRYIKTCPPLHVLSQAET